MSHEPAGPVTAHFLILLPIHIEVWAARPHRRVHQCTSEGYPEHYQPRVLGSSTSAPWVIDGFGEGGEAVHFTDAGINITICLQRN